MTKHFCVFYAHFTVDTFQNGFDTNEPAVYNKCMDYIVFDLEWNQCPDGKKRENHDLPFEIIEIGAVKLNSEKKETDRFHEYIRPTVYSRLHHKTKEILHINSNILKDADLFPNVIRRFQEWCGSDVCYCTWGALDLLELQRNIRYHNLPTFFPFPLKFYDIQKIFSLCYEDGKSRRTLEYAVDMLHIKKDIPFHEALDDASYTASIIRHIPDEKFLPFFSIDYFRVPENRKEEIFEVFTDYSKYVSRTFPSKSTCMHDRNVRQVECYVCGNRAEKIVPWFLTGNRNYTCLGRCPEHGYIKGKIRIKKTEDRKSYFCVKTLKLVDNTRAQEIEDRYQKKDLKKQSS